MTKLAARLSAALLTTVLVGAAVPAVAAGAPVSVSKCETAMHPFDVSNGYSEAHAPTGSAQNQSDAYGHPYHAPSQHSSRLLGISFANATQKPITMVDFGFVAGGKLMTEVRDAGTFAPGVAIAHDFRIPKDAYADSGECVPLQVRFADGTSWKNPHLPRQ